MFFVALRLNVDFIIQEVRTAAKEGVGCIVDGGHPDMGRNLNALKRSDPERALGPRD